MCVGLRSGSKNWAAAEEAGLQVKTVAEAAKWGDVVMMLINDEVQAKVYKAVSYTHLPGELFPRPGSNRALSYKGEFVRLQTWHGGYASCSGIRVQR